LAPSPLQKSRDLINRILDSKRVSEGRYVREFEERFDKLLGKEDLLEIKDVRIIINKDS